MAETAGAQVLEASLACDPGFCLYSSLVNKQLQTQAKHVQLQVNFFAVMAMNNAVAPHMVKQGGGVIVNIGSSTGYVAIPQAAVYAASKHAVRAYSDALRVELSPFGVKVMHVAPGEHQLMCRHDTAGHTWGPQSLHLIEPWHEVWWNKFGGCLLSRKADSNTEQCS